MRKLNSKPLTQSQKIGLLIWALVSLISIWLTGSSLHTSLNILEPLAYLVGFIFVASTGLLLSEIKKLVNSNKFKASTFTFLTLLFLTTFSFSILTNTHKSFLLFKKEDIAKETVVYAREVLTNIGKSQIKDADNRIANYKTLVSQKTLDYYNEVMNPLNPGEGKVADSLKRIVANLLEVSEIPTPSGSKNRNAIQRRTFADYMHRKMHAQLQIKVDGMYEQLDGIGVCIDTVQRDSILKSLKRHNGFNTNIFDEDYKSTITNAHVFYQNTQRCISTGLSAFNRLSTMNSEALQQRDELELPVPAIKIQRINELLSYIKNYPKRKPRSYLSAALYALIIALLTDTIGLVSLYYIVLKKDE